MPRIRCKPVISICLFADWFPYNNFERSVTSIYYYSTAILGSHPPHTYSPRSGPPSLDLSDSSFF